MSRPKWTVRAPSGALYHGWSEEDIVRASIAGVPLEKVAPAPCVACDAPRDAASVAAGEEVCARCRTHPERGQVLA